jgi:hypothetical protein
MLHKKTLLVLVVAALMHDMLFTQTTSPVGHIFTTGAAFIERMTRAGIVNASLCSFQPCDSPSQNAENHRPLR